MQGICYKSVGTLERQKWEGSVTLDQYLPFGLREEKGENEKMVLPSIQKPTLLMVLPELPSADTEQKSRCPCY